MSTCESGHTVAAGSTTCAACGTDILDEIWSGRTVVTDAAAGSPPAPGTASPSTWPSVGAPTGVAPLPTQGFSEDAGPPGTAPGAPTSGLAPGPVVAGAGTGRRPSSKMIGLVGGIVTVVIVVAVVLAVALSSSGPPTGVATGHGQQLTPRQVVNEMLSIYRRGDFREFCTLIAPSQRASCPYTGTTTAVQFTMTGTATASDDFVHGDRALVAVVGRLCVVIVGVSTTISPGGQTSTCESNDQRYEGMPRSVSQFVADYDAAVNGTGVNGSNGFGPVPLVEVHGVWYLNLGIQIDSPPAGDRAAESNLTNALTEASALYQTDNQSFSGAVPQFNTSAPEFTWHTAACGSTPNNCVSYRIQDAAATGDVQVILLADRSTSGSCFYLAEVEQTPLLESVVGSGPHQLDIARAGVFYATWTGRRSCSGSDPVVDSFHRWFGSYASIDANR